MRYTELDGTTLAVSVVGLGGNNFHARLDDRATRAVVAAALASGVNFFDTADLYGAVPGGGEELLGKALNGVRSDVVLATKFGMDLGVASATANDARGSATYIVQAVEHSLRRLRTDYIDLYQYHEPDGRTPLDETLGALQHLVESGKVRHLGCSNFSATLLRKSTSLARAAKTEGFVSVQDCYHLLNRTAEIDLIPACTELDVVLLPYYPLANGLLSGKYERGKPAPTGSRMSWRASWFTEAALDAVWSLQELAGRFGASLLQLAIGWLLAQPAVPSVITGAMSPEQVMANAAAGDWSPTPQLFAAVDVIVGSGAKVV